jgi:hypothetical protein
MVCVCGSRRAEDRGRETRPSWEDRGQPSRLQVPEQRLSSLVQEEGAGHPKAAAWESGVEEAGYASAVSEWMDAWAGRCRCKDGIRSRR